MLKKFIFMLTVVFITCTVNTTYANTAANQAKSNGERLLEKLATFEETIDSGEIRAIDSQYDALSNEIKKTELSIGKVSGKSNRDYLNNTYVKPAKIARERVIYEVSQYRLLLIIENQVDEGNVEKAAANLEKLERLKKRAVEIKKAGGYEALPESVEFDLRYTEEYLTEIITPRGIYISDVDLEWESVTVMNDTNETVDISGWYLISEEGNQRYDFPEGSTMEAGYYIAVLSGPDAYDGAFEQLWTTSYMWNNNGDAALLYNADGELVSEYR
jgi:Lamin Tail Domain/SbsC C-terminal domain